MAETENKERIEEYPFTKEAQLKLLAALPADSDIAMNNLLVVMALLCDTLCVEKIDRTIWSDAHKRAAGYHITIERQMVAKGDENMKVI